MRAGCRRYSRRSAATATGRWAAPPTRSLRVILSFEYAAPSPISNPVSIHFESLFLLPRASRVVVAAWHQEPHRAEPRPVAVGRVERDHPALIAAGGAAGRQPPRDDGAAGHARGAAQLRFALTLNCASSHPFLSASYARALTSSPMPNPFDRAHRGAQRERAAPHLRWAPRLLDLGALDGRGHAAGCRDHGQRLDPRHASDRHLGRRRRAAYGRLAHAQSAGLPSISA